MRTFRRLTFGSGALVVVALGLLAIFARPARTQEAATAEGTTAGTESDEVELAPEIRISPRPMNGPPTGATAQQRDEWLAARLDLLLAARPELAKAKIGMSVLDVASGRLLYARAADQGFQIASVAKVITTGTALATLGPEYRFKTSVYVDPLDGRGTVAGNVYVRGSGDPTLSSQMLWKLAGDLRAAGVSRVTGQVVIDGTMFDDQTLPPAYDQKLEDQAFRAPVSAAALNYSAVTVMIQPGVGAGAPARVTIDPPSDYFVVTNTATTANRGRTSLRVSAVALDNKTEIRVAGHIRHDAEAVRMRKRVEHPALYLGETLKGFLVGQGVQVEGGVRLGPVPAGARALASAYSEPLSVLVRDLNKYSNNFMAETLLKVVGAEKGGIPGTWAKGLSVVGTWLGDSGLARGDYRFDNGSGLYDSNRFSPNQLVRVLRHAFQDFRIGSDFVSALALAGADGTINHRMIGGAAERYVRAKTGTLKNVSCLAGYAGSVGKTPLAFAVLVNDVQTGGAMRAARGLQDDVAQVLVLYLEGS